MFKFVQETINGLLIAGIIESPSMAPASGAKIRLFLSATLYKLWRAPQLGISEKRAQIALGVLVCEGDIIRLR